MKRLRLPFQPIPWLALSGFMILSCSASPANAHFLWLTRHNDQLQVHFSETAAPGEPELLAKVRGAKAWSVTSAGARQLALNAADAALTAEVGDAGDALLALRHDYGVLDRGDEPFFLRYYAKTGPPLGHASWSRVSCSDLLELEAVPQATAQGQVRILVLWKKQPLKGAEVKISAPGSETVRLESDEQGSVTFSAAKAGQCAVLIRHVEPRKGRHQDREYGSVRHYSSLTFTITDGDAGRPSQAPTQTKVNSLLPALPALPEPVTSFGAAVLKDTLYVYGGHTGDPHDYSRATQANTLWQLSLSPGESQPAWKSAGEGPGLQGLAMVACEGKLYRIGGFQAKNPEGEEHDLWSQAAVTCYDPQAAAWSPMPELPQPRSSFDAAVLGKAIYVIGGWQLRGDQPRLWSETAYRLDPTRPDPQWEPLPAPPFQRRALAVAAHGGKLFAIGGMSKDGGPSTRVDVYDPAARSWSRGPDLPGAGIEGFGCSAFAVGGRLYVTTLGGKLHGLNHAQDSWDVVRDLPRGRFFHRLLPLGERGLLAVGGANREQGHVAEIDAISVELPASSGPLAEPAPAGK